MIRCYSWPTPNGIKVHTMLEETGLDYKVTGIDITSGDQFKPSLTRLLSCFLFSGPRDSSDTLLVAFSAALLNLGGREEWKGLLSRISMQPRELFSTDTLQQAVTVFAYAALVHGAVTKESLLLVKKAQENLRMKKQSSKCDGPVVQEVLTTLEPLVRARFKQTVEAGSREMPIDIALHPL